MNFIKNIALFFVVAVSMVSCIDDETYADELKVEKQLIADFIKRNNIVVVEKQPANNDWKKNLYYKTPTGLYISVEKFDTLSPVITSGDKISMRYIQYTLKENADTMRYMNTIDNPFLRTFVFNDLVSTDACKGWQEAVSIMKYSGSKARIIVFSKLGFKEDEDSVVPYGYDMTINISN